MPRRNQNPVAIVVLVVVIAIATAFIIKGAAPKRSTRPMADWTCEECDHKFLAPAQSQNMACTKCGEPALRAFHYYCSVHDQIFEAFISELNPKVAYEEDRLYKVPGGEWTDLVPTQVTCPLGNSDMQTMERCPPTSPRRKLE